MPDSNLVPGAEPDLFDPGSLGTRQSPSIAALDNGGFIVAYQDEVFPGTLTSEPDIYFQLYNADGTPNGSPVQVNTTTSNHQTDPSVVVLDNGDFVVSWVDASAEDGDGFGIFSQRYSATGTAIGVETQVNTSTDGAQTDPDSFVLSNGGHVTVWASNHDDSAGTVTSTINMQRYDAAGLPDGVETTIATFLSDGALDVRTPEVVELDNGNLAISFTRYVSGQGGNAYPELAIVSSTGIAVSAIINPEQSSDDLFTLPQIRIVELGNGNVLATWMYAHDVTGGVNVGYGEIYARIYDASGNPAGDEFLVYGGTDNRRFDLYAGSDGQGGAIIGFVQEDDSVNERVLLGQQVSETGVLIGEPLWFNQNQGEQWRSGEIVALANGDLAVVHQTAGSGAVSDLYTQLIANGDDPRFSTGDDTVTLADTGEQVAGLEGADTITGGSAADVIGGGSGVDIIDGGDGGDTIDGGNDGDTLNGQEGDDFIYGRSGADMIAGGIGVDMIDGGLDNDTIFGEGDGDTLFGGFGSDTIYGGDGDDLIYGYRDENEDLGPNDADRDEGFGNFLFGDAGEDRLVGGEGDDWIYGGSEDDVLLGGGGSDLMFGEGGSDTLNGGAGIDYMWGGEGGDRFYGLDGDDWIRGEAGLDRMNGGDGDDVLIGGTETDYIYGDADTDTLYGEDGDDFLEGNSEGDVLFGQEGDDDMEGGSEGDFLFGGDGADTINGGTENDLMWGDMPGTGDGDEDVFVFEDNWGFDAVYDFELGIDEISMGAVTGLTQFTDLAVIDGGVDVTVVFDGNAITLYGVTLAELNANQADFDFS